MLLMLVSAAAFCEFQGAFTGHGPALPRSLLTSFVLALLFWSACDGGITPITSDERGTQPGDYTLTLSATGSSVDKTSTLALKVN